MLQSKMNNKKFAFMTSRIGSIRKRVSQDFRIKLFMATISTNWLLSKSQASPQKQAGSAWCMRLIGN